MKLLIMIYRLATYSYLLSENAIEGQHNIELVDVEQMYGPKRKTFVIASRFSRLRTKVFDKWSMAKEADRFAGAILLGEILSWCSEEVRNKNGLMQVTLKRKKCRQNVKDIRYFSKYYIINGTGNCKII